MANEFVAKNGLISQNNTTISGSLIQGLEGNIATGERSHAEGSITKAIGNYSHAEGDFTQAKGDYSHAEGQETIASGSYSHAEGYGTIALGDRQHVTGQYNFVSPVQSAFIVGNGTDNNNRSNLIYAHDSTVEITGSLEVNGGITGSLQGTASYALQALSSSYSFTSSYVENAQTASYVTTAQTASYVLNAISSSFSTTASYANQALSSSYALTASYLDNYIPPFPFTGSAIISGSLEVTGSLSVSDGTYLKLNTSTHALYDQIGAQSVDWNIRSLKDSNGINSLYWDSRALYDAIGSQSLDWANRFLYDINDVQSLAWTNRDLFDENGLQSLSWSERSLIDTSFINSVDWENRGLYDINSSLSLAWNNRQLIDSTGVNVILDWSGSLGLLTGSLYGTASWAESASQADTASYVTTLRAGGTVGVNSVQYNNGGVLGGNSRFTFNGSSVFIGNGGTLSATGSIFGSASYADAAGKAGEVSSASFGGSPYTASVLFNKQFPDTSYAVTITGEDDRVYTVNNKQNTGFTINTNSSVLFTGSVYWMAMSYNS
jgi:hypothetical protein